MRFSTTFAAVLAAPLLVSAAPTVRRNMPPPAHVAPPVQHVAAPPSHAAAPPSGYGGYAAPSAAPSSAPAAAPPAGGANPADLLVLKFANVLEQLETEFYNQAIAKFQESDFIAAGFPSASIPVQQFQSILSDETTHTTVLAAVIQSLGDQPITGCQFDFSSVLTDVTTMASVARLVENVGVGAYIGAATLIVDPSILTAAATILTIEARHQSILNVLNGGTAIPQAFDIPLLPQEVLALAGGFISGCDVGIQGLPPLSVTTTGSIQAGTSLSFNFDALAGLDQNSLSCQMLVGGAPLALSLPFSQCVVPEGITGPVAIYVTNDTQPINNNARDKFIGNIVAGPTMAFIDNKPEVLGQFARPNLAGAANIPSTSTQTISPAQASDLVGSSTIVSSGSVPTAGAVNAAPGVPSGAPPTASQFTGPSPDGSVTVLGWSTVPNTPST